MSDPTPTAVSEAMREAVAREDLMVELYAEGRTLREIAPIVRLTHGGVQAALRRRGVAMRKKARRPDLSSKSSRINWKARAEAAEAETARLRAFVQHCEREVYPLVRDSWSLNNSQANAFIDALNEARVALSKEQADV